MNTTKNRRTSTTSLSEFPVVLITYDEPWADDAWEALRDIRPDAKRVHGVKGLNACHVAAAEEAASDWFLTVDADTTVHPDAFTLSFETHLLRPYFRLDWQSRNAVNGLISGNGSLKLWPKTLVMKMRSHEAAKAGTVSLDADIGGIKPDVSQLVLMPGCRSTNDPARTPYHAFRAGFRECAFLAFLVRKQVGADAARADQLYRVISTWCTVGRHAPFGAWQIYGARMGFWAEAFWDNWDIRNLYNYNWFNWLWHDLILARIGTGAAKCTLSELAYDADRLERESVGLGNAISEQTSLEIAELGREASAMLADAQVFPAGRAPEKLDTLGRQFQKGKGVRRNSRIALRYYQEAAMLGNVTSLTNMARLHQLELLPKPDLDIADALYRKATELGCAYAPYHLATLINDREEQGDDGAEVRRLIDLAAERGFAPADQP